MTTDRRTARRYLLGQLADEESTVVEHEYFRDDAALERMEACEEELVEEYLDGRLLPEDRAAFDAFYLSTSEHRARVETIRRLEKAAPVRSQRLPVRWLAAAAVLLIAAGVVWMIAPRATQDGQPKSPSARSTTAPRVFAVTLTPATVRGENATPPIVIPPSADIVTLDLEGPRDPSIAAMSAVISTVGGDRVWEGAVDAPGTLPAGLSGHASVPASPLRPDDYIVVVSGTDRGGIERELNRYFLRVRSD